jgi:hypothetical protein
MPKRSFDRVHLKLPTKHCFLFLLRLEACEIHLTQLLPIVSFLGIELTLLSLTINDKLLVMKLLRTALLLLVSDSMMGYYPFDAIFGD